MIGSDKIFYIIALLLTGVRYRAIMALLFPNLILGQQKEYFKSPKI